MNIRLLKDLDFASKLNQTEAVTEAGKDMLKTYRAYMYSNAPTCGVVNGFVLEAQKFGFDTGLVSILNSVQSYINENKISWKLASACESIENTTSNYSYIAKIGCETVSKLLEMKEADVVSYIKAGSLKSVQYIPEFRAVCKEVYNTTVNETRTPQYTLTNPVSYCVKGANNETYFSVLGKSYKLDESKVSEVVYNDAKFVRMNQLLEAFHCDGENLMIEYRGAHGDVAKFTIAESAEDAAPILNFEKGAGEQAIKESFKDKIAFIEFANTQSKVMQMNEKMNWMKFTNTLAEVFECAANINVIDNVNVLSTVDGTVAAIIEGKDNVNVTVFRSLGAGTSCVDYAYMNEALKSVTRISGVDLKSFYTNRINEDCKKQDPEGYAAIQESLKVAADEAMQARKKKIALLAEQYKNDPVKIALLNKAAADLAILG